jgi:signal transduction histidine kinase
MAAADDTNLHDFKNQLTIIRGFAEILLAEAPPHDSPRRELEEIYRAAASALQLLDRLYSPGKDLRQS